ncbi:hypothetical protein Q3G72_017030 [Acer saccharum]|nr:hypothetical protein Q3G72_009533 [Acer saccharum]KAK1549006.1 hypothetical protein Q3G72_017030 [Acer saccharum]
MGDNAADRCPAMAGPHEQSYQEAARLDYWKFILTCSFLSQMTNSCMIRMKNPRINSFILIIFYSRCYLNAI